MIYLASPYSHPDASVRESRYEAVGRHVAALMRAGRLAYSPILHSHPLAALGLPGDWPFWAAHNEAMLGRADALAVLMIDGFDESRGVAEEIQIARRLGLPVVYEAPIAGDG